MNEATQILIENAGINYAVPPNTETLTPADFVEAPGDDLPEKISLKNKQHKQKLNVKKAKGTGINLNDAIDPLHEADQSQIERLSFDDLALPYFIVKDDWFDLGGKRKPGVWYCYETAGTDKKPPAQIAVRLCSPLYIDGVTNTENGQFFGRLLRFRDTLGHWRKWAMPMELLRGSCEELRGELLAAGVEIGAGTAAFSAFVLAAGCIGGAVSTAATLVIASGGGWQTGLSSAIAGCLTGAATAVLPIKAMGIQLGQWIKSTLIPVGALVGSDAVSAAASAAIDLTPVETVLSTAATDLGA